MAGKEGFPKRVIKKVAHVVDAPIVEKGVGIGFLGWAAIVGPIVPTAVFIIAGGILLSRGINRSGGQVI